MFKTLVDRWYPASWHWSCLPGAADRDETAPQQLADGSILLTYQHGQG